MSDFRVYHSFRSPYSRLGLHIIAKAGLEPELIPFTGPPDGAQFDDPAANRLKLAYYMQDIPRMTARAGLPIAFPDPFDVDLIPSYKAAVAASAAGKGLAFALAVSDARWGEGRNVSDIGVLKDCATKIGWSAEEVEQAQGSMSVAKALRRHRDMIAEDGVFGVPFAVFKGQKFWGQDRFDLLVDAARS